MRKTKLKDRFTEAYLDYYLLIYSVVLTKTGNADDAEDITQEVFLILYDRIGEVENTRKWLYGTMKNLILQYYQKKSNTKIDINEIFEDVSLAYVNGFRDTRIIINEAMENIDKDDMDDLLLNMISIHDFSYSEVAEVTGLSKRQVGYKFNILTKKISEYLNRKGIADIEDLL